MRLGVVLPQTEIGPRPSDLEAFVAAAEEAGFSYVVAYDHVLGADTTDRPDWPGPYDVTSSFHEPFVLYGWLAARCSLELWTGVLVLPQRQTALVAKQAAEVDIVSGGRLRLGVGIGWNPVEYEALGVDFASRAARYEEQIGLLRRLWCEEVVDFTGRFERVDRAGLCPRPVQRPIPLWMGAGSARRALERIGRLGDGWLARVPPGRGLEEAWSVVCQAAEAAGRPAGSVGLQGIDEPRDDPDHTRLRRWAAAWEAAGATHLSVSGLHAGRSPAEHVDYVRRAGAALLG